MAKSKIVSIVLLLIGIAFVLGAIFSWIDNLTAAEPAGLGTWIFDVLQFLVGTVIALYGGTNLHRSNSRVHSIRTNKIQEVVDSPESVQKMSGEAGDQKQKSVHSAGSKQIMK